MPTPGQPAERPQWTLAARLAAILALATAWSVGIFLRADQLATQILVDDEWHLVHRLRDGAGLVSVVGDFGSNDHSIGLGLYAWLLMQLTPLDELWLRLPSLLTGVLLVVILPIVVARRVDLATAIVIAWLLAISPLLCFFSRLARPYAIVTLLVTIATLAFHRWFTSTGQDRQARCWYVAAAASAPLFHLAALPAVIAPFAVVLLPGTVFGSAQRPPARAIRRLLVAVVTASALVLSIPAVASGRRVLARLLTDRPTVATAAATLHLLVGTTDPATLLIVTVFAAIGARVLWRRSPSLAACIACVVAAQIVAAAASGAAAIHVPIVAARYIAVVLPLLLLLPAAAIAGAGRIAARMSHVVAQTPAIAIIALLFVRGPLMWLYEYPNDFTNHASYQADYTPGRYFERFRPNVVSDFYTDILARRPPGSTTIVEAPWYYYWHDFAWSQRRHRQHVVIGFVGAEDATTSRIGEISASDTGIRLRRAVYLSDPEKLRTQRIEYVVLHRDVFAELRWPTGVTDVPVAIGVWIGRYERWCGPPVFADASVVVFATDRCTMR